MQDTITREEYDAMFALLKNTAVTVADRKKHASGHPPVTLEELEALPGEYLRPDQVSRVFRMCPQSIRWNARDGLLPFPVLFGGRDKKRVIIPKMPFIKFMRGEYQHASTP